MPCSSDEIPRVPRHKRLAHVRAPAVRSCITDGTQVVNGGIRNSSGICRCGAQSRDRPLRGEMHADCVGSRRAVLPVAVWPSRASLRPNRRVRMPCHSRKPESSGSTDASGGPAGASSSLRCPYHQSFRVSVVMSSSGESGIHLAHSRHPYVGRPAYGRPACCVLSHAVRVADERDQL
jgi:hypothetical protein